MVSTPGQPWLLRVAVVHDPRSLGWPILWTTVNRSQFNDMDKPIHVHNATSDSEKLQERISKVDVAVLQEPNIAVDEKVLLRKLDCFLLPWLSVLYLLSFLDRSSIGNARVRFSLLKSSDCSTYLCQPYRYSFMVWKKILGYRTRNTWSRWLPSSRRIRYLRFAAIASPDKGLIHSAIYVDAK